MFIIITLFAFLSFPSFGGGQLGTGGNGCWSFKENMLQWKSFEEITFPEISKERPILFTKILLPETGRMTLLHSNEQEKIRLILKMRLHRIELLSPKVHSALLMMSQLFDVSYTIHRSVEGIFEGDAGFVPHSCESFSPALISTNNGVILFFTPIWNKLSTISQEIIIVHETLRLAQIFHPAFQNMSNVVLQYFTYLLISDDIPDYKLKNHLAKYERKVEVSCEKPIHDSFSSFKSKIMRVICSDGKSFHHLNQWRVKSPYTETMQELLENLVRD
jgi:hypothetical protein